jgi:hypothetical protein
MTHSPTSGLLQFFKFAHLPENLQKVSQPFGELAEWMARELPNNPEKTVMLRKLLEAKDCAVRSVLWKDAADDVSGEPKPG